jgi:RNase adapter protein RapZ
MPTNHSAPNKSHTDGLEDQSRQKSLGKNVGAITVNIISFGYKEGPPPNANMLYDVRFLQNPYWVEELRPLNGREKRVQDYVLGQPLALTFAADCMRLLERLLPELALLDMTEYSVALGCTGGQHRSVSIAEHLGRELQKSFPDYIIRICHRELDADNAISEDVTNTSVVSDSTQ